MSKGIKQVAKKAGTNEQEIAIRRYNANTKGMGWLAARDYLLKVGYLKKA